MPRLASNASMLIAQAESRTEEIHHAHTEPIAAAMTLRTINTLRRGRIVAIDAFRGITFLAMIFVNEVSGVSGISHWLKHMPADADAMSFPDVVFPAFLFIVGMSIPFSINARLTQGDGAWAIQRHILHRAFALVVLGVFMVNAEEGFNQQAMAVSIHAWSLLFYAAAFLVWGVMRFESAVVTRLLRSAGVALLVMLAMLYRGGADGHAAMKPQWWGILGLIGWAYFFSCEFYLLSRGRLAAVLGFIIVCVGYYAAAHRGGLQSNVAWFYSQEPHAAHSQIVLAGVACALIFFDEARADSNRRRFAEAGLFAVGLVIAAALLRPAFGISKIYATPSWCLYCAAISVAAFSFLYGLVDIQRRDRWTPWVEPAASSPLVTYMIPFVVEAALALAGLVLPAALREGAAGLFWAAFYAGFVVWVVSRLNKRGIAIRL